MFDPGEDAAPVTAVDGFVNDSLNFHVDAITAEDAIVASPQEIEQAALLTRRRIGGSLIAPCFGLVLWHGGSLMHDRADVTDFGEGWHIVPPAG